MSPSLVLIIILVAVIDAAVLWWILRKVRARKYDLAALEEFEARQSLMNATIMVCRQCGEEFPDWRPQCPRCGTAKVIY